MLGACPSWVDEDPHLHDELRARWKALCGEFPALGLSHRPLAESFLAAWWDWRRCQDVNLLEAHGAVPMDKAAGQLRQAALALNAADLDCGSL